MQCTCNVRSTGRETWLTSLVAFVSAPRGRGKNRVLQAYGRRVILPARLELDREYAARRAAGLNFRDAKEFGCAVDKALRALLPVTKLDLNDKCVSWETVSMSSGDSP